jgi:two-component system response regulator ResD
LQIVASRPSVLVVDEDPPIRALIRRVLEGAGYLVVEAGDAAEALRKFVCTDPDGVLLDIGLRGQRTLDLVQQWRATRRELGLVMLTRSGSSDQEVASLEAGADDYLRKPIQPRVLVARLDAVLRRARRATPFSDEEVTVGSWRLRVAERSLDADGRRVALTRTETALLCELMLAPGRCLTTDHLMTEVWGRTGSAGETKVVHTNIYRLRRKLESDSSRSEWLEARHGVGYIFMPPATHRESFSEAK